MKPAKLTPKQARDITDIGGQGVGGSLFFVLFLGGKEKNAKKQLSYVTPLFSRLLLCENWALPSVVIDCMQ